MIAVLLFTSGAAALAYEVLWAREWALIFGSTAAGTAVVLAGYFSGLFCGALLGQHLARQPRTLRLYAALELATALAVIGYLLARPLLAEAALSLAARSTGAMLIAGRTLLALATLLPATALLGATLPAALAAMPRPEREAPARLYAWNTLGGAAGALGTGFLAIRYLGATGAFLVAIALDLAAAALAYAAAAPHPAPAAHAPSHAPVRSRSALAVITLTGAIGLAGEVLWSRGLAGVLSSSVYSVALVLAGVLLGIVLGAHLAARTLAARAPTGDHLARACAALAGALLLSLGVLRALPALSTWLVTSTAAASASSGLALEACLALIVVLVPALILGAIFPLVVALDGSRALGRALACNTAGGIAGSLLGAFVLLPALGLRGGLLVLAALAVGAAALAADSRRGRMWVAAGAGMVAVTTLVAPEVRLAWLGRYGASALLYYHDGASATVMVTADQAGQKRLRVNSQYSLGGTDGLLLERREGHIPLLLHPAPHRVLALGVGTGATVGALLADPAVQAEGVELLPEALAAASYFNDENNGLLVHPRARLVVEDARVYLATQGGPYDLIVSDLFLPWTTGTAYLYAREFLRRGRERLAGGGLYCQWLPLHQLAADDLASIVATFASVFPSLQVWLAYHRTTTPLALLVGSEQPVTLSAAQWQARLALPELRHALVSTGLDDPSDLAVLYVGSQAELLAATRAAPLISDDRPRLEFTAPLAYFRQQHLGRDTLAWIAALDDPAPAPVAGTDVPRTLRRTLIDAQQALLGGDGAAELRDYLDALAVAPAIRPARSALVAIAAARLRAGDRSTAETIVAALTQYAPESSETLRASHLLERAVPQ